MFAARYLARPSHVDVRAQWRSPTLSARQHASKVELGASFRRLQCHRRKPQKAQRRMDAPAAVFAPEKPEKSEDVSSSSEEARSNYISITKDEQVNLAIQALKAGKPIAILDDESREGETDLFFPAVNLRPEDLRFLRTKAGGEMYLAVGHEVAATFDLPRIGSKLKELPNTLIQAMGKETGDMCQGQCSVGLSFDHRSTHTGAPDTERSYTCRRFAELAEECRAGEVSPYVAARLLGAEFHTPGHIFFCLEDSRGLAYRRGHSDLAPALARIAEVVPVMVGCVMLYNEGDEYGAVSPTDSRQWCKENGIVFLDGPQIAAALV